MAEILLKVESCKIMGAMCEVYNYLKATDYHLGITINYGHYPKFRYERIIC